MSTQTKKKRKKATPSTKLIELTPEAVRRLPKPHKNFAVYAPPLLALYEANIDQMRIKGLDPTALQSALNAYESLAADEAALQKQLDLVKQTRLVHASTVWVAELEIYNRSRAAGRTDPAIKAAIADFEQFMKPRKKKAVTPPVTTPPST